MGMEKGKDMTHSEGKKKPNKYYQGRIKEKEEPEIISNCQSQMLEPLAEVRNQKRVVIREAEDY